MDDTAEAVFIGDTNNLMAALQSLETQLTALQVKFGTVGPGITQHLQTMDGAALGASSSLGKIGPASRALLVVHQHAQQAAAGVSALHQRLQQIGQLAEGELKTGLSGIGSMFLSELAPILTFGAVVKGVFDTFKDSQGLTQLSNQTGIAISNLVVLKQAFSNAGVSASEIQPSFTRIQKALAGINEDGANTRATLRELGLEGLDTAGQTEQLNALQKAFMGVTDGERQAQLAQSLFGKNGGKMLSLLGDPASLERAKVQVGALGQTMERNSANFNKAAAAMNATKVGFQQIFTGIAAGIAPQLTQIFDQLARSDWTAVGAKLGEVTSFFFRFSKVVAQAYDQLDKWAQKALDFAYGNKQAPPHSEAKGEGESKDRQPANSSNASGASTRTQHSTFGGIIIGNRGAADPNVAATKALHLTVSQLLAELRHGIHSNKTLTGGLKLPTLRVAI